MMKRILTLLCVLLIVFGMSATAEENLYDRIENALYRIVLRTEAGDTTLGVGVLFSDRQILLSSAACVQEGALYAVGSDGEHAILSAAEVDKSGLAMLELAQPSASTPLNLASDNAAGMAYVFGADKAGEFIVAPLSQVRTTLYHGEEAMLLSSSEGLLPGSFVTDDTGGLIALSIAQQAEGKGTYLAVDANGIYRALTRQQYADAFLPVESSWQDGILTITWTDEDRGSGVYLITLSGDDNPYYTFFEAEHTERAIELALPPEHRYDFQVQWAENEDAAIEPVWGAMSGRFIPGGAFTKYGYTQTCGFVTRKSEKDQLTHVEQITQGMLLDASLMKSLYIEASYNVEENIDVPMSIELIAPDGQFYFESAVHTLSTRKEKNDAFLLPLDDLLTDCAEFSGGTLRYGQYRVRYSMAGVTAGEYTFTLSNKVTEAPAEAPVQMEAEYGFINELSAEFGNGMVTVTWPKESVPEGASVTCYHLYDGNQFYSYQTIAIDENAAHIYTVPERGTLIWVVWTMDPTAAAVMPEKETDFFVIQPAPEATLTDYNFRNIRLGVAPSDDPAAAEKGEFLPEVALTREILSDRDTPLYFMTEDTYEIDQTDDADHPLAIVLFTPDGMCFLDPSLYIYDVTLQESDLWLKDISSIFADYETMTGENAWPAGDYHIIYFIDGKTAGVIHFTLD